MTSLLWEDREEGASSSLSSVKLLMPITGFWWWWQLLSTFQKVPRCFSLCTYTVLGISLDTQTWEHWPRNTTALRC